MTKSALAIFEDFKIRRQYDEKTETWYFSIVDVIYALTQSKDPLAYWRKLKQRLKAELKVAAGEVVRPPRLLWYDGLIRLSNIPF